MPKAVQERIVMPIEPHQAVSLPCLADQTVTGHVACPADVTGPDTYGLVVNGDCMAPHVHHGDTAILSPAAPIEPGTIVVLWPIGDGRPVLKRLVMMPMCAIGSPVHPDSTVVPLVIVEQTNPPKRYAIRVDALQAMHALAAVVTGGASQAAGGVA